MSLRKGRPEVPGTLEQGGAIGGDVVQQGFQRRGDHPGSDGGGVWGAGVDDSHSVAARSQFGRRAEAEHAGTDHDHIRR